MHLSDIRNAIIVHFIVKVLVVFQILRSLQLFKFLVLFSFTVRKAGLRKWKVSFKLHFKMSSSANFVCVI